AGTAQDLYLDLNCSSSNAEAVALCVSMTLTVYADPNPLIATSNRKIGQGTINLGVAADPTHPQLNHTILRVSGSVTGKLLIQVTSDVFIDTGHGNTVHYD